MRAKLSFAIAAMAVHSVMPANAQPAQRDTRSQPAEATSTPPVPPSSSSSSSSSSPSPSTDELTTEQWRPPAPPNEFHWHLLSLPERLIELAFAPVGVIVTLTERYRLDRRVTDALENDAGTVVLRPAFKLSGGDGLGAGLRLKLKRLLGEEGRRVDIQGLRRLNKDTLIAARYRHSFARLEGRTLDVRFDYETDRDAPWFGIGNDTAKDDERVVRDDFIGGTLGLDLSRHGQIDVTGKLEVGYRHETLEPGVDATDPSIMPGDTVALPPGFDRALDFLWLRLSATRDNRDTVGRPTRGVLTELEATVIGETSSASLGALAGKAQVTRFFELFPGHRVLIASLGFAGSTPLTATGEVPMHALPTLGRKNHLRGYQRGRFRDRLAWWGSLEYRWPIYEYKTTGVTLAASVFADLGRVGSGVGNLLSTPVRYAGGFAFRVAHETVQVGIIEVGFSPEGPQLTFNLGKTL